MDGWGQLLRHRLSPPCQQPMRLAQRRHSGQAALAQCCLSQRLASQSMQCNAIDKPCIRIPTTTTTMKQSAPILLEGRCEGDMEPLNWGTILQPARERLGPHPPLPFHRVCKPSCDWLMDTDECGALATSSMKW